MGKKLLTKNRFQKISMLFEENNKDSLACRDILSWYIKCTEKKELIEQFDITTVGHWLLNHHQPFIDEFSGSQSHTRESYQLQSKRPYIKNRLQELVELELIEEKGTTLAEKGVVEKQLYAFTEEGYLWSWLIEARYAADRDRRSFAVNNFFGELSAFVVDYHTSFTDSFVEYVNRCTNEGLFTKLDEYYFEYLVLNLYPLTQNYFRFCRFEFLYGLYTNQDTSRVLLDIINKTDEETQQLILLQLKLDIESNYYDEMNTSKEWEKRRYDNIGNHTLLTLQGYCLECKLLWPYIMNIFEFLKIGSKPYCYSPDGSILITGKLICPNCNKPDCRFVVPVLYIPTSAFRKKEVFTIEYMEKVYDTVQTKTPKVDRSSVVVDEYQKLIGDN
jgi:hypothetical protein